MDYRLENLSEDDFEELVNTLCEKILGIATVGFSKGKDAGRDGRFKGKCNSYPSETAPWTGTTIIQSKHTSDYDASCADKDFYGNLSSLINKEIPKIQALKNNGAIDNYLLFTNRKETASREDTIEYIKAQTGLVNVDIIGKNTIHRYIEKHQDIAKAFRIGNYALPLTLTENDIKDVIIAFKTQSQSIQKIGTITEEKIIAILKEEKNQLNNLTQSYYNNEIKNKTLEYFTLIDDFLGDIKNIEYQRIYLDFASELSNKIAIKRSEFDKFEDIFIHLYDAIFAENKIALNQDKRFIWIFLHHLYFNCDIGRTE